MTNELSDAEKREATRLLVMGLRAQIRRSPGLSAGPLSDEALAIIEAALSTPVSTKQDSPVLGNAPNGGCTEKVERYERVEQAVVNLEYGTGAVGEFVSADTARQLMRELAAERRQYAQCSEALNRALSARAGIIEECAKEAERVMNEDYDPHYSVAVRDAILSLSGKSK